MQQHLLCSRNSAAAGPCRATQHQRRPVALATAATQVLQRRHRRRPAAAASVVAAAAAAAAAAAGSSAPDFAALLAPPDAAAATMPAQAHAGPVRAVRLKGAAAAALEASKSVAAGETLLVSLPLARVRCGSSGSSRSRGTDGGDGDGGEGEEEDNEEEGGSSSFNDGDDDDGAAAALTPPDDADLDALATRLAAAVAAGDARALAWLPYLDDGSLESAGGGGDGGGSLGLPDLKALAAASADSATATSSSSSSSSSGRPLGGSGGGGNNDGGDGDDDDVLLDIADVNARRLAPDAMLAAALLGYDDDDDNGADDADADADADDQHGGGGLHAVVGLWPELALVQHSCAPNAQLVLVPGPSGAALLTASRPLPKQALVTANLLGSALLAPLAERHARLAAAGALGAGATPSSSYPSSITSSSSSPPPPCGCRRCRDEARQDANLRALVQDCQEAAVAMAPELSRAVEADDEAALLALRDQLAAYAEVVDAAFTKLNVGPRSQASLQASLFRLYEACAVVSAALGEPDARLMQLCAAIAGEADPGSAEHVFWAAQVLGCMADDEDAPFDGGLAAARKAALAALRARYGAQLLAARPGLAERLLALQAAAGDDDGDDDEEEEEGGQGASEDG